MSVIASTENSEIECHDDMGVLICETGYDAMAYLDGEWWYIDDDGHAMQRVPVN